MTVSAMELRKSIGDILNRIQYTHERVVIERKGEPAAALVSVADLARLEQWEAAREAELFQLAKAVVAQQGTEPFTALLDQYEKLHGETLELPRVSP
jgi:prevent-host-death family protein